MLTWCAVEPSIRDHANAPRVSILLVHGRNNSFAELMASEKEVLLIKFRKKENQLGAVISRARVRCWHASSKPAQTMDGQAQYGIATAASKLDCVQIDGLVVLKIIKHSRDEGNPNEMVSGQLLGMDITQNNTTTLEVGAGAACAWGWIARARATAALPGAVSAGADARCRDRW
jgi:hypothetical protein